MDSAPSGTGARVPASYGAWPSPIGAAEVAAGGVRLSSPLPAGDPVGSEVWWTETRPADAGRVVVVRRDAAGTVSDVLPAGWSARTRVHEYGGQAWLPLPDGALVFANWTDQRVYRLDAGATEPVPLTPEPAEPAALRYADPVRAPGGAELWWIREVHTEDGVTRHVVAVPLSGAGGTDPAAIREITGGSDFLAFPRPAPDGRRIAWIAWDHPRMPWDGTELRVGELGEDGTVTKTDTILGGESESVLQPEWADAETLTVVSDRSGWWNLYRVPAAGGEPAPLCPRAEEFGQPLWTLGQNTYQPLPDGRLVVAHGTDTIALGLLDPATGALTDLDLPYTAFGVSLSVAGGTVFTIGASPVEPAGLLAIDLGAGTATVLRTSLASRPDPAYLPTPRSITVPGPGERDVHAHVYPPTSPGATAPAGELPPYVVFVHGGPTAHSSATLDIEKAYFTSRGIGVVDVNYGGSTGYGRAYRERLRRQWGIVDVEDCVAVVQALVRDGLADGARLAIRGGSAGGWTTLAALTTTDTFTAGASYYGVAELIAFAADTHDFESRYIDGLVGTLPEDRDVYVERAPLSHVDQLSCPVLLLQGLEDKVVPPSQAELFVAALEKKGIPHAYLAFEGEQHGFRKQETVIAALEAELSFYGQVFGFDPPGVPRLALSEGTPPSLSQGDEG
ncbi:MAG TPA: prolyl oligopeptidase family serine peptidase [Mycobacteriales bacterium]|jgi:dipeptidyl aminopeptidase/acylaminoacyl peptidase|nr:prolyl oligopeptidase family serine peptidase [Mycobacteriales bacterium]